MPTRHPDRLLSPLDEFEALQPLRWAFYSYLDCNLFLVRPFAKGWRWSLLFRAWNEDSPIHLEHHHGRKDERIAFDRRRLEACLRTGKPAFSGFRGLHDLLVPVRQGRRVVGVLLAGPLRREPASAEELRRHWRAITGRNASADDPELIAFARLHYRVPCLGDGGLRALQRALQLYAEHLGSPERAASAADWERLAGTALTRHLGHRFWAPSVLGQGPFDFPARWGQQALMPVERGPMRFSGPPRAVLVLEPLLGGQDRDPLDAMAAGAQLLRAAFLAARAQPDVEAVRLDDRRTLLLLRPQAAGQGPAASAELRRGAQAWRSLLEKHLRRRLRVTVGGPVEDWAPLRPALLAALGQEGAAAPSGDWDAAARDELAMGAALQGRDLTAFRGYARAFARRHEALSYGQPQALRHALLAALARLLRAHAGSLGLGVDAWRAFVAERLAMDAAAESRALLAAFDAWVDRLAALRAEPTKAGRALRLESLRRSLAHEPQRPWTLAEAAREAGYGPSAFSRAFQAWQGLGFRAYLRRLRLQAAAERLRGSELPVVEVAALSGYPNPSHFGRLFKAAWGLSPQAYRKRIRKNRTSGSQ